MTNVKSSSLYYKSKVTFKKRFTKYVRPKLEYESPVGPRRLKKKKREMLEALQLTDDRSDPQIQEVGHTTEQRPYKIRKLKAKLRQNYSW